MNNGVVHWDRVDTATAPSHLLASLTEHTRTLLSDSKRAVYVVDGHIMRTLAGYFLLYLEVIPLSLRRGTQWSIALNIGFPIGQQRPIGYPVASRSYTVCGKVMGFSMPFVIALIVGVVFTSLLPEPALAERYSTEDANWTTDLVQTRGVNFTYDARVELDSLFGEPVINTTFRWQIVPRGSFAEIPSYSSGERTIEQVPLEQLGAEALDKVRLYDVELQFGFRIGNGQTVYLLQDAGDPGIGDGEQWSFNVAGSPDWSELFYTVPINEEDEHRWYLSEDEAKRIYVQPLDLVSVDVISPDMSFHDLQEWYARQSPEPRAFALEDAYQTLADGIQDAFGFDVEVEGVRPFDGRASAPDANGSLLAHYASEVDRIMAQIERLSDLPDAFREQGDERIYNVALAEAGQIVRRARQFSFESAEADPADFRQGGDSKFNGSGGGAGEPPLIVARVENPGNGLTLRGWDGSEIGTYPASFEGEAACPVYTPDVVATLRYGWSDSAAWNVSYLTSSGARFDAYRIGDFTGEFGLAQIQNDSVSGRSHFEVVDQDLNVVAAVQGDFETDDVRWIGGFHQGWAAVGMIGGDIMISTNGEVISGQSLGYGRMEIEEDFTFGDAIVRMFRASGPPVGRFLLSPDGVLRPKPDELIRWLPGGLEAICTARSGRGICSASQVRDRQTGAVVLDEIEGRIDPVIHQRQWGFTIRGDNRNATFDLSGELIEIVDSDHLAAGTSHLRAYMSIDGFRHAPCAGRALPHLE